jgi:hypothetical protein
MEIQVQDVDDEDIPTVVITGVGKNFTTPTSSLNNVAVYSMSNNVVYSTQPTTSILECFPTITESAATEDSFEMATSEDSRRSSATSDTSSSSNHSSPRSSFSSGVVPTTFLPHSATAHYYRRPSSNTLQVPTYPEIGFLHHRNSIESGDRLSINMLRADFLRRRSLSSLQPQLLQDVPETDQYGQRRFSAPPPMYHPDMKYRRSSSLCRDLKHNFLKLRRSSDMVRI